MSTEDVCADDCDSPLLVLDLGLDVVNGVGRLDLEGDSLAGQGLDEDLHTTTKTEDFEEIRTDGRMEDETSIAYPGGESTPSECCSQREYARPQAASRRR